MKYFPVLILTFPVLLSGQSLHKKQLSAYDYAGWKTIGNTKISDSGQLTVYELNPQKGDGQLLIFNQEKTTTINRGKKPEISPADDFIVYTLAQPEDTLRKAKLKKVKKEEMPQDSLGILLMKTNTTHKYPRLKSYGISEENASWIAFTSTPEVKKDTSKTAKKVKTIKQPGDDLILFNTETSDTLMFKSVTEFFCPKKGGSVYFVQQKKDSLLTYSSVKRLDAGKSMASELFFSEGFIKKIVADEFGEHYSFLFSKDTASVKSFSLYLGNVSRKEPHIIADKNTMGMPGGWSPSENGALWFSRDASKIYFGTAPTPVPEPKDSMLDEEKPKVDVWNWKDLDLQSQQKTDIDKEKKKSYTALFNLRSEKFLQLADTVVTRVSTIRKGDSDLILGEDDHPYRRAQSWTGNAIADFYLIDVKTGNRRQLAEGKERASLSPAGNYIIWYEQTDSSYYVRSTSPDHAGKRSLTRSIPVKFYDERNDLPDDPRPYGIAGWSEDDRFVFIYDRYDIWKTDPTGKQAPVCVTQGYGRKNHLQFRYVKTDKEEEFIPSGKMSLLKAFDTETMSSGFFNCDMHAAKEPSQLLMSSHFYGAPIKAANADRIIWTRESFSDYPDLWTSNLMFENLKRISQANLQQADYNWLTAELVEWKSFNGETLKGLLYKPENLDPSRKYPMIVYFYERNSENLNRYSVPSPSRSTINRSFYCSNGYLVFIPDITYRTGYPGQSAYDAIVSGVYHLADTRPYVNLSKMGLQGQSWGGYQTAYLITRTDLFAAAMAGAPVSNMTSAYGGIRWESGVSRMFQYEHQQSRIGGTLWDKPMHYIENSPLFSAPKVKTPLLMMHNDNDGAVPWYQGIEFFVALRRLDKPVWMLTYNGEPHNLKDESWANRMDLDKRMFQFFDHFLKGGAMPPWMQKGIPAIDKGKNPGY